MTFRTPKHHAASLPDAAVAALQQYRPALHRYLKPRLRGSEDVNDLAQEVLTRYWQIAQQETIRNPPAFIYRLASNFIYEFRLRERRGIVTCDSELAVAAGESANAWDNTPEEQAIRAEQIARSLNSMPKLWRAILLLSRREGLAAREIARQLKISEKTVYMYLGYAIAHFRKEQGKS
jgi:RNA polymerase sigma factor (sigma-70 family)